MAPDDASADDQIERLTKAEDGDYDVIGVDVADADIISPVLDEMVDSGYKVMTFSSSDAHDGCKRIEGNEQETSEYNKSILDRAFTLVNAVNKRAVCQNQLVDTLRRNEYNSKGDMETLVLQERQRELMFEGKRWFDLVRLSQRTGNTSTLTEAALAKATIGQGLISNHLAKMDAIYWPYNLDEMKVNLNLVQNPAFGSGENDSYEKTTKK